MISGHPAPNNKMNRINLCEINIAHQQQIIEACQHNMKETNKKLAS